MTSSTQRVLKSSDGKSLVGVVNDEKKIYLTLSLCVKRDNCQLVREVIQTSLDKILIDQNVQGAIDYVKSQIADLLQNKMDISRLVITKSLNKGAEYALGLGGKKEDYKVKQAHVELAARMRKRDAGSAPQMGDRVSSLQAPREPRTLKRPKILFSSLRTTSPLIASGICPTNFRNLCREFSSRSLTTWRRACFMESTPARSSSPHQRHAREA